MIDVSALTPQAVALLQAYAEAPDDVGKAREAARAISGCQQWEGAAGILRRVLQGGRVEAGDLLDYGFYLLQAQQYGAVEELGQIIPQVFGNLTDGQRQVLTDLGQTVYPRIARFYATGQQKQAEVLADMILPYEPFGRRLLGIVPPVEDIPRPAALTDDVVAAFLRDQAAVMEAGDESRPLNDAAEAGRYRGRRALIIHRQHYHPNPESGKHPACEYFLQGAVEAGLDARLMMSDFACGLAASFNPEQAARDLAEISAVIEQWQPEIVICDAFGGPGQEAITTRILDLRTRQGFRLIGIYHDVWSADIRRSYEEAMRQVDAIWFFDPLSTTSQMDGFPNAIGTVPPIPETPFAQALTRVQKTRALGFIGSIWNSNHIRGLWLMALTRKGGVVDVVTGYPYGNGYQDASDFADFMASCKVTLCFCGRTSQQGALPGRIWEGIWSEAVLLEDDTPHLRQFLVPFVHYIPFRTLDELMFYSGFLQRRDDLRQQMATRARDFVRSRHSARQVWDSVLDVAMSGPHVG